MNIAIEKPTNWNNVSFTIGDNNESTSNWITFYFLIKKDIEETGFLFFLEAESNHIFFQNRQGSNCKRFNFGKRTPLVKGQILKRRVKLFSPKEISNGMSVNIILYSNINELLEEDNVILNAFVQ
jgi:hypothetical protein